MKKNQELLSRRSFLVYRPEDACRPGAEAPRLGTHMVIDGMTLRNLDVLLNSALGTQHGSLFERLNRCSTAFGQRLLRHWICAPLCRPQAINDRLDAVQYLIEHSHVLQEVGNYVNFFVYWFFFYLIVN